MNLAIPNYGWEVVNHSMVFNSWGQKVFRIKTSSTVYINNIVYLSSIMGMFLELIQLNIGVFYCNSFDIMLL